MLTEPGASNNFMRLPSYLQLSTGEGEIAEHYKGTLNFFRFEGQGKGSVAVSQVGPRTGENRPGCCRKDECHRREEAEKRLRACSN